MPAQTLRLRSTPSFADAALTGRIDRANAVIYGVTAMQSGVEAIGHGVMADTATLTMMAQLGNATTRGVRSRFGHPGMSENAAGRKVAVGRNFRVDGDRLVHDSHLLESARISPAFAQDPIEFILNVAETAPTELAESAVLLAEAVWVLDDGREMPADRWDRNDAEWEDVEILEGGKPVNATTDLPVIRPIEFAYIDFVNEGALTHNGMFSASIADSIFAGTSSEYLHEAFELVDAWRAQYRVPLDAIYEKMDRIVHSYIVARGGTEKGADLMATRRKTARKPRTRVPEHVMSLDADGAAAIVDEADLEPSGPVVGADDEVIEDTAASDDDADLGPSAADADETLDAAEAELAALTADLAEVEAETSTVSRREFDAHRNQLARVAGVVEQLQAKIDRTAELLAQNLAATQAVHRNQQRLAGEPVVSERVARVPETQLDPLEFAHPQPGEFAMNAKPVHVSQRAKGAAQPSQDPAQRLLERQEARRRRTEIGGQ